MTWSRRRVVQSGLVGLGAALVNHPAFAATQRTVLRPGNVSAQIGGHLVEMLGFNNQWPGPPIRAVQGETLDIRVENGLDDGALVHWHGLRLPNRMDGVNVLTQDVIPPGQSFDYRFDVPDAGTYWYHSHYISYEQVSRGLFGPLIIEERNPPQLDHDITVQLFDILTDASGQYDEAFDQNRFLTDGRIGNTTMAHTLHDSVARGDRVRLRLINPSVDRVYVVAISGLSGVIAALDGMPLAAPRALARITLAPGQRCDVIGDVLDPIVMTDHAARESTQLGEIAVNGSHSPSSRPLPFLPSNPMPTPDAETQHATLLLQGGAGGGPHNGFGGWALNNTSGLPQDPFIDLRRGSTVRISLKNDTAFDHVMHLHGHHFWELTTGERARGDYRDGTLVPARATRDILCVLDNPGAWMLHCHMLSHQADGMATWVQVR